MIVKLLTERHLEYLSLKEAAEARPSTHVKMLHCWKSHATAHFIMFATININLHDRQFKCIII